MAITSSGLGSGLDINGIITQLMQLEQRPLVVLATNEAKVQQTMSALGTLKGALSSFQTSVKGLTDASKFQQTTSSVSDSTIATVSAGSTAQVGSFGLEVSQLAVAHKIKSATAFAKTTDVIGTGKLTIQLGTYSGGLFTANPDKSATTITIDSSKNTLSGMRDAINAAGAGVRASIVNDGSGNRLVLSSSDTGTANSIRVLVDDDDLGDTDTAGLSQLAYDPTAAVNNGKNLSQVQAALDSNFKVDGLDIVKSSNNVSDVMSGVTLNLLKVTTSAVTVNVARDTSTVSKAVQEFAKAYNALNTTFKDLGRYSYNKDTKVSDAGPLQGEAALRSAQAQLRATMNGVLSGGGTYSRLSQVGLSFQKDGSLAVDTTKLNQAVKDNYADVASLFAANGVPTDSGVSYVSAGSNTQPGNYPINITQLATKGHLYGSAITVPAVIDSDNDTLKLKIDGVSSGTITLTQGTSYTGAQLAAELQSKINGDSLLKAGSVAVSVAWNSTAGRLEITSNRYGSASKVEVMSLDTNTTTTFGIAMGAGTDGVDVAGSVGGTVTRGVVSSSSAITAPVTIDADNDLLQLKIDGVASGNITLTAGSYTGTQLAAELQTRINADSALTSAGVSTAVNWNATTNKLEIYSSRYGTSSTVEITAVDTNTTATMFLGVGAGTAGTSEGGALAGGSGQTLTVSEGSATGLKLTIGGTTTGPRGTVPFNRGFAFQLDQQLDTLLSSKGLVSARVDGLNASIKDIGKTRERLQEQLTRTEARLRAQYTALDVSLSKMKQTSTYLSQQLAALSSSS